MRHSSFLLLLACVFAALLSFSYQQTCAPIARCEGVTCGIDVHTQYTANNTGCDACSWDDVGARFTECQNGKKNLFFFWKPPATCLPSAELSALPAPVTDLDCSLTCAAGKYFDTTTKQCQSCSGGTFADSAHILFDSWTELPPQMSTSCEKLYSTAKACSNWRLQGDYIDSGDNWNNNLIRTNLEYNIEITELANAYVSFEYKVSAEQGYDFLYFMVNKQTIMRESNILDWTTYRYNFTATGYYTLTWMFSKDISFSQGEDIAKIRKIDIKGTTDFATRCESCPAGKYSDGNHECLPCPPNTYSNEKGASVCKPCPPSTISFAGAKTCFAANTPCTADDYYFSYTACDNGQRQKIAKWIEPVLCNTTHVESVVLPAPTTEACPPHVCQPGQFFDSSAHTCKYCPLGTSSPQGDACVQCSAGTASDHITSYITEFDKTKFTTGCEGECRSGGWRFAGSQMDSGVGNGVSESWVEFTIQQTERNAESHITFDYVQSCMDGEMVVYVDQIQYGSIQCSGCADLNTFKTYTLDLSEKAGRNVPTAVGLSFRTRSVATQDTYHCERVIVKNINIVGAAEGGAPFCSDCKNGTFSVDGEVCVSCPAGTYNTIVTHSNCTACPANTFSYPGSASCIPCGKGTTSAPGSAECTYTYGTCAFKGQIQGLDREFSWSTISKELFSVPHVSNDEPDTKFYFNLCEQPNHPVCANDSLICKLSKTGKAISLGDELSMETFNDISGVKVVATNYRDVCVENSTGLSTYYTTEFHFICRMSAQNKPAGPVITRNGNSNCHYIVEIVRDELCPTCTEGDFYEYTGACEDYKQTKTWMKRADAKYHCYGGVDKTKETTTVACTPYTVSFPYWILAVVGGVVLIVVIALIAVAGVLYYKYRDVSKKYFAKLEDDNETNSRM